MRIFITGTSGYIGGSIAVALAAAGHEVSGLVRSERSAEQVAALGIIPVHGTLDDADILAAAAARADAVINSANADHEPSAQALLGAIEGTGKRTLTPQAPALSGHIRPRTRRCRFRRGHAFHAIERTRRARCIERAYPVLQGERRSLDHHLSKPHLRHQPGPDKHSMQVPLLIELAKKAGAPGIMAPVKTSGRTCISTIWSISMFLRWHRPRRAHSFCRERREFDAAGVRGDQLQARRHHRHRADVAGRSGARMGRGHGAEYDRLQQPRSRGPRQSRAWLAPKQAVADRRNRKRLLRGVPCCAMTYRSKRIP